MDLHAVCLGRVIFAGFLFHFYIIKYYLSAVLFNLHLLFFNILLSLCFVYCTTFLGTSFITAVDLKKKN